MGPTGKAIEKSLIILAFLKLSNFNLYLFL